MGFLSNLFIKKEEEINTNADFWNWFKNNERAFYKITKSGDNINKFHEPLSEKLNQLREGYFFLSGMLNDDTAELIITADGNIKNLVFVEQLIADAPSIQGWKFTAHKPALDIENVNISMNGYTFSDETLSFYAKEDKNFPDEIDIVVVNSDFTQENKEKITVGTQIFLDNFLGEINFVTSIDNLTVIGKEDAIQELIPIEKLKAYLIWREKEFVEKYESITPNLENNTHSIFEYSYNSQPIVAVMNTDLLEWNEKASYPWIMKISIAYDGSYNNGMPNQMISGLIDSAGDKITEQLENSNDYLYIGRETGCGTRDIFFACKDFRKPSLIVDTLINQQTRFDINYSIYKDKYWMTFRSFQNLG
ncbi:MAG: DUF695 domain-containing protein [Flavobacterium psychrophilum]|nr:MAG: DUF695 domain-containing protein [Flavobacterium psychrophilum]